jgi:hypothetical protein
MDPIQGPLWEGVLPGVLRQLYVGRSTGVLRFERDGERRRLRFRGGNIVGADSGSREDHMGEVGVRRGLLTTADLKRATGFMLRDRKRLGTVLLEQGMLDNERLESLVAAQVQEVMSRVFSWAPHGTYAFDEGDEGAQDGDITLRLSTGELILQAARGVQDPDVIVYCLGDLDRIPALSTDPLLRFQRISLSPADGYVLSRVDGHLSARDIVQLVPISQEEACRSLYGLVSTGVIEFLAAPAVAAVRREDPASSPSPAAPEVAPEGESPAPAAAPSDTRRVEILDAHGGLKTRTHYEVLGIGRDATDAQVKEAYFRLARRFHPDVHHDQALSDLKAKLEAVFVRLGEAYEVLRNPRTRASYEQRLGPPPPPAVTAPPADATPALPEKDPVSDLRMAEAAIRTAAQSIAEEKFWDAIGLLETALPLVEGASKQRARVLLARAYARNAHWIKQGEELLLLVIQEDPRNAEAPFHLGQIYKSQGFRSRALNSFKKVLELDPEHEGARAEVAELDTQEPAPERGGFLRRLFRPK